MIEEWDGLPLMWQLFNGCLHAVWGGPSGNDENCTFVISGMGDGWWLLSYNPDWDGFGHREGDSVFSLIERAEQIARDAIAKYAGEQDVEDAR